MNDQPTNDASSEIPMSSEFELLLPFVGELIDYPQEPSLVSVESTVSSLTLSTKFFHHLCTYYYLMMGTRFRIGEFEAFFPDMSSILTLGRAAFEAYSSFHFLFINECSNEEREVRFVSWKIGGLWIRRDVQTHSTEDEEKLNVESVEIKNLRTKLEGSAFFKSLDKEKQKSLKTGRWKVGQSYGDFGAMAGLDQGTPKGGITMLKYYAFTTAHAHSDYLSIMSLRSAMVANKEGYYNLTVGNCIMFGLILMSHFINDFVKIFPTAREFLLTRPDIRNAMYDIREIFPDGR